jgi:hypothetical protein
VSKLPALILRRSERLPFGTRPGLVAVVPRPRPAEDDRAVPVIRRGVDALRLLDVAPPAAGLRPGSLVLGFAVGAAVASRRRPR